MQGILKNRKAVLIERVKGILALSSVIHDTSLNQYPHIMGKGRLGNVECFKNFAAAQFAA